MTGDYKLEFLFLPKEDDPDSFIRKHGSEEFDVFLSQALPLSEALLFHLKQEFPLDSIESRAQFVRAAVQYLDKLPKGPYQDLLINAVADAANIGSNQVYYQLERYAQNQEKASHLAVDNKAQSGGVVGGFFLPLSSRSSSASAFGSKDLVEYVIAWIIQYPALVQKLEIPDLSRHSPAADLLMELISFIRFNPRVTTGMLLAESSFAAWADWLSRLAAVEHTVPVDDAISELKGCFQKIIKERDENSLEVLIEKSRSQSLTEAEKASIDYILRKNR
jgi:DNA primase